MRSGIWPKASQAEPGEALLTSEGPQGRGVLTSDRRERAAKAEGRSVLWIIWNFCF